MLTATLYDLRWGLGIMENHVETCMRNEMESPSMFWGIGITENQLETSMEDGMEPGNVSVYRESIIT